MAGGHVCLWRSHVQRFRTGTVVMYSGGYTVLLARRGGDII